MQDYNEIFSYGPRGWPMWMPPPVPAAPTQWQLVPVETAKPKEHEKVFAFGSEGPPWLPPSGFKWQLVEAKKEEKKPAEKKEEKKKEKLPEIVLKVKMCCGKCEDIVKEGILTVDGVTDVKTDKVHSKVTVVGKADEAQVLKKAKKVDWGAKVVEVKKGEAAEKKPEEKKKEDTKKKEEPNITWTYDPRNYFPTFYPPPYPPPYGYPYPTPPPPFHPDGTYRPSQAYPPHYYQYPETDYSYYNYPNNPRYLTHIRHS